MVAPIALADAASASAGSSYGLALSGSAVRFPPLEGAEAANASRLGRLFGDAPRLASALAQHTRPSDWCALQRSTREMHVTIIGVSVTQGCGAGRGQRCLAQLGWARRLADAFATLGGGIWPHGGATRWSIWPKNAAPLRFWLQCTASSFELSPNTSLVLVETEPTLTPTDERELQQLVRALRHAAPHAVIGFVLWPSMRQLSQDRAAERMVVRRAAADGFDAISASALLDVAMAATGEAASAFYGDLVHPNIDGHAMLAGLVCSWLLGNLVPAAVTRCASARGGGSDDESSKPGTASTTQSATLPRRHTDLVTAAARQGSSFERCYARADEMPTIEPNVAGWHLRDEGRAKGVLKLGYVSAQPGAVLRLGPILPDARCGVFDVSLGYLLSWRREQGALDVSCSGSCTCEPMYQYRWQKYRDHEPFPRLQTWTHARGSSVDGALANASTTAYARFLLVKLDAPDTRDFCAIHVAHARSESSSTTAPAAPSRVRVDGLSLKLSSCATQCVAVRHAKNRTSLNAVRSTCAAGAARGEAGFYAPSCNGCEEAGVA